MISLEQLEQEIEAIKARNQAVEKDKAWKLSWMRRVCIFILTYIVVVIFFLFAELPKPFLNSIVPALAFMLSTLSIKFLKFFWIRYIYKNN